jgi:chromosome segregation ATPase
MVFRCAAACLFLTALSAVPAGAQTLEDRLRDQLRATMNQVQQLQDQQATLEAEKTQAEKERDQLKAQLAAAQAKPVHTGPSAAELQKEAELQAEVEKYKEAATQAATGAQQVQVDRDKAQTALADAHKLLEICDDKNAQLLKTGNDILDAYQKFDLGDAIGANEPFTGIKRVELENEAQGFDDRLHAGRFDPTARPPATKTGTDQ